jgi:hypothetical protein
VLPISFARRIARSTTGSQRGLRSAATGIGFFSPARIIPFSEGSDTQFRKQNQAPQECLFAFQ